MPGSSSSRGRLRLFAAALLVAGGAGGAVWWFILRDDGSGDPSVLGRGNDVTGKVVMERPAPPSDGFVGSTACKECHRNEWEAYQAHPMARSMFRVTETSPPEDYERGTTFTAGRRKYRVEKSEDHVLHHEIAEDHEGQTIYDQGVEVHYAVGSGKRGRSYFIDRGGLLFMSPISWYSEKGEGRWDLSPSYPAEGHQRFERRIVDRCVSCHVGRTNSVAGTTDRFNSPPFQELSIGCEQCHGPGENHARLHRSVEEPPDNDPIVNPAKLTPSRREAVCNQCHLQGQQQILRYGRGNFDFRPGMHLGEVWSVFVEGTGVADDASTKAVSQVEQMAASRCYQKSEGKLGCISCHDPHFSPSETERTEFYRTKCLTCHAEAGCSVPSEARRRKTAEDSCIVCHMPRLEANDVPHTTQTDHRVVRDSKGSEQRNRATSRQKTLTLFDAHDEPLEGLHEARARGLLLARLAERDRRGDLAEEAMRVLEPVAEAARDDVAVLDALAVTDALHQRRAAAVKRWERIVVLDSRNETALFSLATDAEAQHRPEEALRWFERLVDVNPWMSRIEERRASLLQQLERRNEGIRAAEAAVALDPSRPEPYRWLSEAYKGQGDESAGRRNRELLRRLTE